ncbi:MAG: sulfite exporter TauE/SafE family protein [Gammaproteobacteria bacterium]|nr:sulfite exporter TauE/SafE family protein [Gammaproteobacteria bacterium]
MSAALLLVYAGLAIVEIAVIISWVAATRRHQWPVRPGVGDLLIGCVTCFLDTLGIGNYAQITAAFKLRGHPADELIPGTLNVGNALNTLLSSVLFVTAVRVEPLLLLAMVASAAVGAWIGAGIVSRLPRRPIQLLMGIALLIAAGFFTMTNLGIIPPSGTAMSLAGWRFAVAVTANFVLGALMSVGIGNYAPSMALLSFLGMHPIAAYPIMMASDGMLIPVASLRFLRTGRFSPAVAVGLTLGGIVGTVAAFPLVRMLGDHLTAMRWAVTAVITYAAVALLRSARERQADAGEAQATISTDLPS